MYETEKSLRKAAHSSAATAPETAKKLAIPARRAVSASFSGARLFRSAPGPATAI